jgi:IMP cyclohydrolase
MKKPLSFVIFLVLLALSVTSNAQQARDFDNYVVHYNALNTNFIPAQVAKGYGIQRSSSRALLNITILKKVADQPDAPVNAAVTASGTNLTGQRREIEIREIQEKDGAIYYIGELPVHNLETYNFTVEVIPQGAADPLIIKFQQQFYTE